MQHYVNFELWHQEDMARDPDAPDSKIAAVKRAIDVLNQRRNDMIEQMDQYLLRMLLHLQQGFFKNSYQCLLILMNQKKLKLNHRQQNPHSIKTY